MSKKIIKIEKKGNLANTMIQYMAACRIKNFCPDAIIQISGISNWGIEDNEEINILENGFRYGTHAQNTYPSGIGRSLFSGKISSVYLDCWAQRMENFPERAVCKKIFNASSDFDYVHGYDENHLLISIRGNEVLTGIHEHYSVLPYDFYKELEKKTSLKLVFFGQIGCDPYTLGLRKAFPDADFVSGKNAYHDFEVIRRSKNIVLSISTFSWMAAYLSDANRIIMPLYGLFNPFQARSHNLVPINEKSYEFYIFPYSNSINIFDHPKKFWENQNLLGKNFRYISHRELSEIINKNSLDRRDINKYLENFDIDFYKNTNEDVFNSNECIIDPIDHFIKTGFHERRKPFSIDTYFYTHNYSMAACEIGFGIYEDHWDHYLEVGKNLGYDLHAPFNYWSPEV